ncbi:MAG: MBG domain-containing protein, partial [Kiritimatiellia bacterium]
AATTWADAPGMVVLAGNGHYDYLQANTAETNQLPPMLVQTPAGVCASDGLLADAGGDALPDVAIGRLPAKTPEELAAMIAKIQAYEADFGAAWQNQISLAADPADAVGNFTAENDKLAALATDPYSVAARIDLDDMAIGLGRATFMNWFNAGVGFIHFTGHGDMKNLGAQNLLTYLNGSSMTNSTRPPILVSLTCLAARFEYPSVSSLGEVLLQRADGGAVAVLGPSGLTRNAPASELGQAFYAAVFQEGAGRLGLAFLRARQSLPASLFTEDTLAVYNLLGDPALRIAGNEETNVPRLGAQVFLSDLSQTFDGTPRMAAATTIPAGLAVRITYGGSTAPPAVAGTYAVAATVATAGYEGSTTGILTVAKAAATVSLGDLAQGYDGSSKSARAATDPVGLPVKLAYNGSPTAPTAAGPYEVVGTVEDANYEGAATGTLVVAKAPAVVLLDGLNQVYDGAAKSATALTAPSGLAIVWTCNGDCMAPVGAGSYEVVAEIDEANFAGSATGTLMVAKAAAIAVLEDLAQTYDGAPRWATAITVPAGLAVDFTYEGSETAPSAAGTYAVTGTVHDANYAGSATGTLGIAKAVATVMLESLAQPYDGAPKRAAALTDPWALAVDLTYDGGATAPVAEGSYAVEATVSDANYVGSAAGTLVISAPLDAFENWLHELGLDPADENFATQEDDDDDGRTTWEEYVADTRPNDPDEVFAVAVSYETGTIHLAFPASPNRFYQLAYSTNLTSPAIVRDLGWGGTGIYATNGPDQWFGIIRVRLAAP